MNYIKSTTVLNVSLLKSMTHGYDHAIILRGAFCMENQPQIIGTISAQNNCGSGTTGHTEKPPC